MSSYFVVISVFVFLCFLLIGGCAFITILHIIVNRRRKRQRAWFVLWRPLLLDFGTHGKAEDELREIASQHPRDLLALILQMSSRVQGDFTDRLEELIRTTPMLSWIESALKRDVVVDLLWACKFVSSMQLAEFRSLVARLLGNREPTVVFAAAQALGSFAQSEDLPKLMQTLQRFGSSNQDMITFILVPFAAQNTEALIAYLEHNRAAIHHDLFVVAIDVLGMTGNLASSEFLSKELMSPRSEETLIRTIRALGSVRDLSASEEIAKHTNHDSWIVRSTATWALGALFGSKYITLLEERMEDPHWNVRLNAANALSAMGQDGLAAMRRVQQNSGDDFAKDMAARNMRLSELAVAPV